MDTQETFHRVNDFLDLAHGLREELNRRAQELLGLTVEQVLLLCRIDLLGRGATISALALSNRRASHTVSGTVERLVRLGLVSKGRRPSDDRRQVYVSLTPSGRAKVALYRRSVRELLVPVFSGDRSPELATELERLIRGLKQLLRTQEGETS